MQTKLALQPVATYSSNATSTPTPIVHRVTGTSPENSIHIERLGTDDFKWCIVWYRLEQGQWSRISRTETLFDSAQAALEAVAIALERPSDSGPFLTAGAAVGS